MDQAQIPQGNDAHAKLKKDLDHALVMSRVLTSEKAKLGVDPARLTEDLMYLTRPTRS